MAGTLRYFRHLTFYNILPTHFCDRETETLKEEETCLVHSIKNLS